MYDITDQTISSAYRPFDIVTNKNGGVGFIKEVSVNHCQPEPHQISYSVHWLVGVENKTAWFNHDELSKHCNLFVEIAKCTCHPFGQNSQHVDRLMGKTGTSRAKETGSKNNDVQC